MEHFTSNEGDDKNNLEPLSLRILGFSPNPNLSKQYLRLEATVSLLSSDRKTLHKSEFSENFLAGRRFKFETQVKNITPLIKLYSDTNNKSDSFEFLCDIWLVEVDKKPLVVKKSNEDISTSKAASVLTADSFCDFTVECRDGSIIYVHKHIFVKNCRALQEIQVQDNVSTIKLSNTNPKAAREAIRFIYTGKLDDIDGVEKELVDFGNKFEIEGLAEACLKALQDGISVGSCVKLLTFSYVNSFENLQSVCLEFVASNLKEVRQHETWKLLSKYPDLLMEILNRIEN